MSSIGALRQRGAVQCLSSRRGAVLRDEHVEVSSWATPCTRRAPAGSPRRPRLARTDAARPPREGRGRVVLRHLLTARGLSRTTFRRVRPPSTTSPLRRLAATRSSPSDGSLWRGRRGRVLRLQRRVADFVGGRASCGPASTLLLHAVRRRRLDGAARARARRRPPPRPGLASLGAARRLRRSRRGLRPRPRASSSVACEAPAWTFHVVRLRRRLARPGLPGARPATALRAAPRARRRSAATTSSSRPTTATIRPRRSCTG